MADLWMRGLVERAILERDGSRDCFYCGTEEHRPRPYLDHVVAAAKGGSDNVENLVFACRTCNLLKGRAPGWFFMFWRIATRPLEPPQGEQPHEHRAGTEPTRVTAAEESK